MTDTPFLIYNSIGRTFPHLSSNRITFLVEIILGYDLLDILEQSSISKQDIDFIAEIYTSFNITSVEDTNVVDIIMTMLMRIREETKGSSTLRKVFISEELYNDLRKEFNLDEKTELRVQKVLVLPSKDLDKNALFGLCDSKFNGIGCQNLLILGNLV